jgi:membrane protein YdbS with pleckstrin-like domain
LNDPLERLDPRAVGYWRVSGVIPGLMIGGFLSAPAIMILGVLEVPPAVLFGVGLAVALSAVFIRVVVAPPIWWRVWRYRVSADQLFLQRGLFVVRRTLIPLVRVQNVDTIQGPIARRFGLSEVAVSTAANTITIPALADEVAEELRDRIAELARLARDDD